MTLYIVNQSPFDSASLEHCIKLLAEHDQLILIDDGVYALHCKMEPLISLMTQKNRVFALEESAKIRGVISEHTPLISYDQFVELCESRHPVVSW